MDSERADGEPELQATDAEFESLLRKAAQLREHHIVRQPVFGQIIAGKYRIDALLGQGGMGAVFRATHLISTKPVAIKWMLRSASDEQAHKRFVREARVNARIDHPNVVDVYDLGQQDDANYLVMELLRGESLRERLKRGVLGVAEAVALLLPAMRGVGAAHRAGVVHRDLKPDNIFVCKDPDGSPRESKVLDFGISAMLVADGHDSTLTRDGMLIGTPAYMSSEQLENGHNVDARADVYSFGVILYEVLTGCLPFDASSYSALVLAIATQRPKSPKVHRHDLPEELAQIVLRAIEKRREDRYPTMDGLIEALAPYANVQHDDRGAPTPQLRAPAIRRRQLQLSVLLSATLLLLVVGWLASRANVSEAARTKPITSVSAATPSRERAEPPRAAPAPARGPPTLQREMQIAPEVAPQSSSRSAKAKRRMNAQKANNNTPPPPRESDAPKRRAGSISVDEL